MFVFRPQSGGHTPGGGPPRPNAGHRATRSGVQAPRRARPRVRRKQIAPPRPGAPSLRQADLRAAIEPDFPAGAGTGIESTEDRSAVRARLRARLIDRRSTELVATWQRRHGSSWTERLLCEDFQTHQELHRICEALALRPDLEVLVLDLAKERAKEESGVLSDGNAKHDSTGVGFNHRDFDTRSVESGASSWCTGSTRDSGWSTTASQLTTPRQSPAPSPEMAPMSAPFAAGVIRWDFEVEPGCGSTSHSRDGESASEFAPCRAAPVGPGLQPRLLLECPQAGEPPGHACPGKDEGMATVAGGDAGRRERPEGSRRTASGSKPRRDGRLKVKFAYKSAVRFLRDASNDQYEIVLYTKAFDGPSGHKARRRTPSPDLRAFESGGEEGTEDETEAPEDETETSDCDDEDWEDTCDDIAELMSQPRGMFMWSPTWA